MNLFNYFFISLFFSLFNFGVANDPKTLEINLDDLYNDENLKILFNSDLKINSNKGCAVDCGSSYDCFKNCMKLSKKDKYNELQIKDEASVISNEQQFINNEKNRLLHQKCKSLQNKGLKYTKCLSQQWDVQTEDDQYKGKRNCCAYFKVSTMKRSFGIEVEDLKDFLKKNEVLYKDSYSFTLNKTNNSNDNYKEINIDELQKNFSNIKKDSNCVVFPNLKSNFDLEFTEVCSKSIVLYDRKKFVKEKLIKYIESGNKEILNSFNLSNVDNSINKIECKKKTQKENLYKKFFNLNSDLDISYFNDIDFKLKNKLQLYQNELRIFVNEQENIMILKDNKAFMYLINYVEEIKNKCNELIDQKVEKLN